MRSQRPRFVVAGHDLQFVNASDSFILVCCRALCAAVSCHPPHHCACQVVPSIAIAFVTYEVMKDLLGVEIRISD